MKLQEIQELKKVLQVHLKPSRYEHSIGVAHSAMALAMKYGCDLDQAGIAGYLHDWAKQYEEDTIIQMCRERQVPLTKDELRCPAVLHAKLGAVLVPVDFQVTDPEILNAIRYHTTGKPNMSLLEKILYIADYIEPNRDRAPHLAEIRQLAFSNLDQALVRIMKDTILYLTKQQHPIDEMTLQAYSYYQKQESV